MISNWCLGTCLLVGL